MAWLAAGALRAIDTSHPGAASAVAAVLKPLEVITRNLPAWAGKAAAQGEPHLPSPHHPPAGRQA